MKKGLVFVFLFFCAVVLLNYCKIFIGSFRFPSLFTTTSNHTVYDGLPYVNVDFFGANGIGKSYITQGYGVTPYAYLYINHWHDGIDIAANYGEQIYSPTDGTVLATGDQDDYCYHRGFGKYVAIKDDAKNVVLWYAHLGTIAASSGEKIKKDTMIGTVGATGYEFGVHLHFSTFDEKGFSMQNRNGCGPDPTGTDIDPIPFLEQLN
jgi:murein DD-endopeptidase MepM/ murein hydrolase activator NlpD